MDSDSFTILRGSPYSESIDLLLNNINVMSGKSIDKAIDAVSSIKIERASLEEEDLPSLYMEPDVIAIARNMPISLVDATRLSAHNSIKSASEPLWGIKAVKADLSPYDGSDVVVAVLDTGIDASHDAFVGVNLIEKDFTSTSSFDAHGHGTHCAGTIFGRDVAGTRIGVAPGVNKAIIAKVLDDSGSGSSEMLFDAMVWSMENKAKVVSMSLGFDFPGMAEKLQKQGFPAFLATSRALESYRANVRMFDKILELFKARSAFDTGTVVVAAAGNESRRDQNPKYEVGVSVPAVAEGVVSVGALEKGTSGMTVAPFSNTNPIMSAPGVDIISARSGGGLVSFNGTSMACPHVAGVAALWWQAVRQSNVTESAKIVENSLMSSCTFSVISNSVPRAHRGLGVVQAPMKPLS